MYINKNPDQERDLPTPLHNASAAWLAQRLQNVYAVCNQSDALEWQQQAERSCRLDGAGVLEGNRNGTSITDFKFEYLRRISTKVESVSDYRCCVAVGIFQGKYNRVAVWWPSG